MSKSIIDEVFQLVSTRLSYAYDTSVFGVEEYWKSWKDEILAGETNIKDDCDGFALTAIELAHEKGMARSDLAICLCKLKQGRKEEYHLVAKLFNDDDKQWYVIDNNVRKATPVKKAGGLDWRYEWISCMKADKPGNWINDVLF